MSLTTVFKNGAAYLGMVSPEVAEVSHCNDLAKAFDNAPEQQRYSAAMAIYSITHGKAWAGKEFTDDAMSALVPSLVDGLKDSNPNVRRTCAMSLGWACVRESNWDRMVGEKLDAIARSDSDPGVKDQAAFFAGQIRLPADQRYRPIGM